MVVQRRLLAGACLTKISSLNDQDDLQAEDFYSLNADVKAAGEAATEAARNGRDFPDVEGLASERQGGRRAQG